MPELVERIYVACCFRGDDPVSRALYAAAIIGATLVAAGLALATFYPSIRAAGPDPARDPVVTFRGGEITQGELQEQVNTFASLNGMGDAPPGSTEYEAALSQVVPYMVQVELARAYARENGITVSEEEVSQELDEVENGPDDPELRATTRDRLILQKVQQKVAGNPGPTDKEVKAEYERVKELRYTTPERRCARQFLFEKGQVSLAENVKAEIERGTDFAQLAEDYPRDQPSGTTGGGIVCWERNGALTPIAVEKALFDAEEGRVLGPISSVEGLHLIEVTEIQPRRTTPLDEAAPRLREELAERNRDEDLASWMRQEASKRDLEYRLPGYKPPA